ncbi:hypothetical protein CFC21_083398 [Triticum aestivum]|uniref:AP2/ERF domain-containing protein n=1 Tax=Triticum aestivum TaxID=4565 RepID=A0A9R1I8K9_WHEAT|nr:hypothetical protein CFC21_083398 [Triticum aestivum]
MYGEHVLLSGISNCELIAAGTSTAVKNNFGRNCWYRHDGTIIGRDVTQYFCSKVCNGKDSLPVDLPKPVENEKHGEVEHANVNPLSVHPLPLTRTSDVLPESSNGSDSLKEEKNQYYPGKEIKRRKRHRRKQYVDQEPCIMRGVYFKNMKWQAAIKVDKKQIHLGTVGTQDEAARLYDRAAFMCGREPNFELSEEEKNELVKYTWDDFLAITRNTITSKKQRKVGSLRHNKADLFIGDTEMVNGGGSSNSDDGDVDTSIS